jgi:hypothetical protein
MALTKDRVDASKRKPSSDKSEKKNDKFMSSERPVQNMQKLLANIATKPTIKPMQNQD